METARPTTLGRYEILEELGRGSMGVVYLAKDPLIGRLVALKTFQVGFVATQEDVQENRRRFIREAQSAGILSHPGIVTVHDVVERSDEGVTFIAMEYVRGSNLKELLRRGETVSLARMVDIVVQVAKALDYAHSRGVVHRDIKPANLLITDDGQVKITDFGIARMDTSNITHEGQLLGTPNYMAPEQVLGEEVDHRADIFSLGVVLYEMATGAKPFTGENLTVVAHRIAYDPFTPLAEHDREVPPGLEPILVRALAKEPGKRYSSAHQLASDLRQLAEREVAATSLNDTQEVSALERRRRKPRSGGLAVLLRRVVSGVGGGLSAAGRGLRGRFHRSSSRRVRLGTITLLAALATFGIGSLLVFAVTPKGGAAVRVRPADDLRIEYVSLVREGRLLMAAGDPLTAAAVFRRAQRLAPDRPAVSRLRQEAERRAEAADRNSERQAEVGRGLRAAAEALGESRFRDATESARAVLALEPDNAEARRLLGEVQRQREEARRRRLAAARPPASPGGTDGQPRAAEDGGSGDPATTGNAELEIRFDSYRPEGVVVVLVGDQQVMNEKFSFYKRKILGLFKSGPYAGRVSLPAVEIAPGARTIRVFVTPHGQKAVSAEIEGSFPAGTRRLLQATFSARGRLTLALD